MDKHHDPYLQRVRQVKVMDAVHDERDRQDEMWGPIPRMKSPHQWLAFLTEEVGEVAKAIVDYDPYEHVREELVHVAAVAVAAIEDLDHKRDSEREFLQSLAVSTEVRR